MPPVNAEAIDWVGAQTEAPVVVVDRSPCDLNDALEAVLVALAGAVSAEALKDLASLVEAMRAGRFIAQLQTLQASYMEALAPFGTLVAAVKTGNISAPCFIFHFAAALLGLVGKAPSLAAHLPYLVLTAPFRWCWAQYQDWSTTRQLTEQQTRREEIVAAVDELQQRIPIKQEADKAGATGLNSSYWLRSSWAEA